MTDKLFVFQCVKCGNWFKEGADLRVWEKEVLRDKIEPDKPEREGEMVWCRECYEKLDHNFILQALRAVKKFIYKVKSVGSQS